MSSNLHFSSLEESFVLKVKKEIEAVLTVMKDFKMNRNEIVVSGNTISDYFDVYSQRVLGSSHPFNEVDFEIIVTSDQLAKVDSSYPLLGKNEKDNFYPRYKLLTLTTGCTIYFCPIPKHYQDHFPFLHMLPQYKEGKLVLTKQQFDAMVNKHLIVTDVVDWQRYQYIDYERERRLQRGWTLPDNNNEKEYNPR